MMFAWRTCNYKKQANEIVVVGSRVFDVQGRKEFLPSHRLGSCGGSGVACLSVPRFRERAWGSPGCLGLPRTEHVQTTCI